MRAALSPRTALRWSGGRASTRADLPVHAVGVGEGLDDLRPFEARDFANSLMGLEA